MIKPTCENCKFSIPTDNDRRGRKSDLWIICKFSEINRPKTIQRERKTNWCGQHRIKED